jgi:aspartokinase
MTPSAKLGGFKVLKDVVRITTVSSLESVHFPAEICRIIAEKKINLPYFTCLNDGHLWGVTLLVDAADGLRTAHLVEEASGQILSPNSKSVVLSVFPHRKNPEITGALFEAFGQQGIEPEALANSPSAISVVLKEEVLNKASEALFEPFSFSAYRTPADWKDAQKGKEKLYKEVVASYQEQRPKVYGLEVHEKQELIRIILNDWNMGQIGGGFREFSRLGLNLSFLATGPGQEKTNDHLAICLPTTDMSSCTEIVDGMLPKADIASLSPVALFFMNGPHFGDRYGIVRDLLTSFLEGGVDLLGLSCTIASITGIVPSHQIESAIQAIQTCFEVPSVNKKTG